MRYLSHLKKQQISGKICLLRVDFNVENERETLRLYLSLPTIKFLLAKGLKVVLLSHRGHPQKDLKSRRATSLRVVLPFLKRRLKKKITFFSDFDFKKIRNVIQRAPSRTIFLMENLRFLEGEGKNSLALAKELARLGDIFINDAFSVSHRKNSSVTQLPRELPSFAGLLLEKEIINLNNILHTHRKPLIVILGGAKVHDKIGVIKNFLPKASHILIGGLIANTFLKAKGLDIGKSKYEPLALKTAREFLKNKKILLPIDFISSQGLFLDIGPLTIELFKDKLKQAQTIFWNGPLGFFEQKKFAHGSNAIARFIAGSRAFSVIGGGETTQLIHQLNLEKKIGFLSTGGGAMLKYLSGKKLPGIEALK